MRKPNIGKDMKDMIRKEEETRHFEPGLAWWGYVHTGGTLHVKRYFSDDDLVEAIESPFVDRVYGPWNVVSREQAMEKLQIMSGITG